MLSSFWMETRGGGGEEEDEHDATPSKNREESTLTSLDLGGITGGMQRIHMYPHVSILIHTYSPIY